VSLALVAFLGAMLLTLLVARAAFGPAVGLRASLSSPHVVAGLAVAAAWGAWLRAGLPPARFWQITWGAVAVVAVGAAAVGEPLTRSYGDSAYILVRLGEGTVVAKWLGGTAVASWVHAGVWKFPPFAAALPATMLTPEGFLATLGALTIAGFTIAALERQPLRLAAVLPTLTPIWLMLSVGYLEYYPLIAGAMLVVLLWLFEGPLELKAPRTVGLVTAALPLLYIGFLPLAALILAGYLVAAPRRLWATAGWLLLGYVALAALLWPPGVADYLRTLHGEYNLGEAWNYPRYQGQVAGEHSIFFRPAFALSPARLREVATMYLWGGGLVAPGLLLALGAAALRSRWEVPECLRDSRLWLALALIGWQGFYLVFMVPKLGPERDIDLFFGVYAVVAFCAGLAADALWPDGHPRRTLALASLCGAMLGGGAVSGLYLMRLGVLGL
jgi:hypothetical protein